MESMRKLALTRTPDPIPPMRGLRTGTITTWSIASRACQLTANEPDHAHKKKTA